MTVAALLLVAAGCTDPTTLAQPSSSAPTSATVKPFPSSVGVLRVDMDMSRPPVATSDDRGCSEPLSSIDLRRPLGKELGVASPEPGPFATSRDFFLAQQPERIPEPGATTIPGLALVLERLPGADEKERLAFRARWENRVDKRRIVMRPIEGSLEDWRAPSWHLVARDPATKRVYRFDPRVHRTCGNMARYTVDHYLELEAGARTPAGYEWSVPAWELPKGKLELWVTYRFCGFGDVSAMLGSPLAPEDVLREDVARGLVASNALAIHSD
jgi:hypothetical protein